MTDVTTFDYVVVGGGTAGCIVAKRIAEETDASVALVETGPTDAGVKQIQDLRRWHELLGGVYDYDYSIEDQPRGNGEIRHSRGRMLGGCSSHNSCIAFVPPDSDFETWGPGWDADAVRPYFKRVLERVNLELGCTSNSFSREFIRSAVESGYEEVDFGKPFACGVGWLLLNKRGTQRQSSSIAYIHSSNAPSLNPTLVTESRVERILFDGTRATAVETSAGTIHAAKEIVICAGAFGTPQLLMLSGVGPVKHLTQFEIPCVLDHPGVGENLVDHPEGVITWALKRPLPPETIQKYEVALFDRIDSDAAWPDIMFHMGLEPFDMCTASKGYKTPEHGFSLTPNITRARCRGHVRLRDIDPSSPPRIDFRYYTDPESYDERIMVEGIRRARAIAQRSPLSEWIDFEAAPGPHIQEFDELSDYVRRTGNTVYHPAGTCAAQTDVNSHSVVDTKLRVHGLEGLRIADASVFPTHVSVNPNLTVMMVAERCASFVSEAV